MFTVHPNPSIGAGKSGVPVGRRLNEAVTSENISRPAKPSVDCARSWRSDWLIKKFCYFESEPAA